jgi:hypothetical protein
MCRIDEKKQKRKMRKIIKKNNKMRRVGGKKFGSQKGSKIKAKGYYNG